MIFPQWLLLSLCALIPIYFIYVKKNQGWAVQWLVIIIVLDIFNSQLYMNVSAILIFGLVAVPYLWHRRVILFSNPAVKVFFAYFILLTALGLIYGFIHPWPDSTGLRSIKDQASMRTILHLGRTFCEWNAIFYLALQLQANSKATLNLFLKTLFYCSIILILSTLIEKYFEFDSYHFFTGGRQLLIPDRPRGFCYEPRGLSQNLAYAILLTPFVPLGQWRYALIPVFFLFAFFITISFTGLMVLGTGLAIILLIFIFKKKDLLKLHVKKIVFAGLGLATLFGALIVFMPAHENNHLRERLSYFSSSHLAEKLEVFDAAAVNFFVHHPGYEIFGTGPGLISLPAGEYILERDRALWGNHFEALPHMGLVLILSNSGVVGLIVFLYALFLALRAKNSIENFTPFVLGCMLCGIYFIQMRYYFVLGFACALTYRFGDEDHDLTDQLNIVI